MIYKLSEYDIQQYLQYCDISKNLNTHTLKAYQIDLSQFYRFMDNLDFFITKDSLQSYINYLHKTYQKTKTVKRKIAAVKAFFAYLIYQDKIDDNPMSKIRTSFREPKLLPRTISTSDLNSIFSKLYDEINKCKTDYQIKVCTRNAAVIELLFSTGIRVSELCQLKDKEINLNEQYIRIFGKGAKERIIQIGNPEVLRILLTYRSLFKDQIESCGYFFINKLGNPLSEQSVRLLLSHFEKELHLPQHITPHMFRHTFATKLLEEDVDIRYIQHILGHSSITTTQIYTHIHSNKQKEILKLKNPRNFIHRI